MYIFNKAAKSYLFCPETELENSTRDQNHDRSAPNPRKQIFLKKKAHKFNQNRKPLKKSWKVKEGKMINPIRIEQHWANGRPKKKQTNKKI